MKNKIIFIISVFVLITVSMLLWGCSNNKPEATTSTTTTETPKTTVKQPDKEKKQGYSLVSKDGKNYIVFEDISNYYREGGYMEASVRFDSFEDFKYKVINGRMEEWQKRIVASSFKKDDFGILICDFNNLYLPVLPVDCQYGGVYWENGTYDFEITGESFSGYIGYLTQSVFDRLLQYDKESKWSKHYVLTEGEKTVEVIKSYSTEKELTDPLAVPSIINLYGKKDNLFFEVGLYNLSEEPDDSYLMQFDMVPEHELTP